VVSAPAPAGAHPLSLHDALPISVAVDAHPGAGAVGDEDGLVAALAGVGPRLDPERLPGIVAAVAAAGDAGGPAGGAQALDDGDRSEEHTSELQSRENLVCRLLLE